MNTEKLIHEIMKYILEKRNKYQITIFEEIRYITEKSYGNEYFSEEVIASKYSAEECRVLKRNLTDAIVLELQKEHSFLETARLVQAIIELKGEKLIKNKNSKINYCLKVNPIVSNYEVYFKAMKGLG